MILLTKFQLFVKTSILTLFRRKDFLLYY